MRKNMACPASRKPVVFVQQRPGGDAGDVSLLSHHGFEAIRADEHLFVGFGDVNAAGGQRPDGRERGDKDA
jgi:hypothetical protein